MRCPSCGAEVRELEKNLCPICGARVASPSGEDRLGPDWEKRASPFDTGAIVRTVKALLFEPTRTFSTMRTEGDLASPLIFGVGLGTIGLIAGFIWKTVFRGTLSTHLPSPIAGGLAVNGGFGVVLLSPIIVAIVLFVAAGIDHVMLIVLGSAKRGFEATFRAVAYSQGAVAVFQLVPACGGLVGGIWALVLVIIGLRQMHETTTGRAVAAVLLPVLVCIGCAGLLTFLGAAAIGTHPR